MTISIQIQISGNPSADEDAALTDSAIRFVRHARELGVGVTVSGSSQTAGLITSDFGVDPPDPEPVDPDDAEAADAAVPVTSASAGAEGGDI